MARDSDTMAPSPMPGKMNTLLAWPICQVRPARDTGPNGDPVATSARPSDHAMTSAGTASEIEVGLDSGRTMGRSVPAAIALMIGSENVPPCPVVPIRIVGESAVTTPRRSGSVPRFPEGTDSSASRTASSGIASDCLS